MATPVLAIFSGLPGTGKTTLAAFAAKRLQAAIFSIDVIEAALWRSGIGSDLGSHGAAYELLGALSEGQLLIGRSACTDAVVGLESTRVAWRELAAKYSAEIRCVECICSDTELHRRRIGVRQRGIPGWPELTWADVERSAAHYQPWLGERLVLDAAKALEQNQLELETYLFAGRVDSDQLRSTHW